MFNDNEIARFTIAQNDALGYFEAPHIKPYSDARQPASNDNHNRARKLDQYYTCPSVAADCMETLGDFVDLSKVQLVEPSAGDGSFLRLMPADSIGIDKEPRYPSIYMADFLKTEIFSNRDLVFVGNPPFGRCSNMAVRFFNHAAKRARLIAMILPQTFRKGSIQRQLNPSFHLIHDETVKKDAFLFCGKTFDVPTTFQIWERRPCLRELAPNETRHADFVFTTRERADFAIQRVGKDAGRIHYDFDRSDSSTHFILGKVQHRMRQLNLRSVAANTAGNPSIGRAEIVALYSELTGRPTKKGKSQHPTQVPNLPNFAESRSSRAECKRHVRLFPARTVNRCIVFGG